MSLLINMIKSQPENEILSAVIGYQDDVNVKDMQEKSALMYACQKGYNRVVEELLKKGAAVDASSGNNITSLMHACMKGHKSDVGKTPLAYANANGNQDVINYLTSKGAKGGYRKRRRTRRTRRRHSRKN
jgi:ankyrin repeat protein